MTTASTNVSPQDVLDDLEYRGLVYQVTNRDHLSKKLNEERVVLYCGFDPTADSLHIGNLLAILTLRRFQLAGHVPIALVGGGTGLIGDPSGRSTERTLNGPDTVAAWSNRLKNQLSRFLDFEARPNAAKLVSNYDWLGQLDLISFLRDVGKHFTVNYMLAKDSVDSRLAQGISFTEFSYMIMQAYDYRKLHADHGCSLQIGGSDQWGNITAGLDLIGKMGGGDAYGMTMPLVTKSDGKKFGKSESGAIWLDRNKTTAYQFYQFWINTDDADVIRFLKYFTFLNRTEIEALEEELRTNPEQRVAQKTLAREVTRIVHGQGAVDTAEKVTLSLFSGDVSQLGEEELIEAMQDMASAEIGEADEAPLIDLLVASGLAPSKRQARQDIESGAVYVNGHKQSGIETVIGRDQRLFGKYVILRRGKKNYAGVTFR
ncbi:tyrosine--tRNA ligase [Cohnella sp. CFH 77786]|uniref:tyrosine--tRNA ligase n=1 Tax=Cohnella sp. CFH 77786 TaxID=2662265 RepID=UPI001C61007B|nr:tyrosine--tRNA ligase [Cohnella sp. CFH 77786]MBW5444707.1 tyrosine--tRNA ligase [Cohnella sp. CFH 77786]